MQLSLSLSFRKAVAIEVNTSETVGVFASSSSVQANISQTKAVTQAMLDTLEGDTMEESWRKALQPEFQKSYFTSVCLLYKRGAEPQSDIRRQLKKFLLAEMTASTVYPAGNFFLF